MREAAIAVLGAAALAAGGVATFVTSNGAGSAGLAASGATLLLIVLLGEKLEWLKVGQCRISSPRGGAQSYPPSGSPGSAGRRHGGTNFFVTKPANCSCTPRPRSASTRTYTEFTSASSGADDRRQRDHGRRATVLPRGAPADRGRPGDLRHWPGRRARVRAALSCRRSRTPAISRASWTR